MFNYEMACTDRKQEVLKKYIYELEKKPSIVICQMIEKVLCYFDLFDKEMIQIIFSLVARMKACKCCKKCCKKKDWWEDFEKVIYDFNSIINSLPLYNGEIKRGKVAVVVPNRLSASSFLQPPVDSLMIIRQLKKKNIDCVFIDNRVKKMQAEEIFTQINDCEYVVVTSTPYDHIQNYFLDYRLKYVFLLIDYIKKRDERKKIILCGAHGSIRPDIVFNE